MRARIALAKAAEARIEAATRGTATAAGFKRTATKQAAPNSGIAAAPETDGCALEEPIEELGEEARSG
jgi:hypothetical protein